jgi:hypothetical protein
MAQKLRQSPPDQASGSQATKGKVESEKSAPYMFLNTYVTSKALVCLDEYIR